MNREKSCGAIIFRGEYENSKVLLVHQNQGHWSFPKGHVEPGEEEHDTARREVSEETGLDIEFSGNFRFVVTYSPKEGVMKDVVFFTARPLTDSIVRQEEEIAEVRWVGLEEAFDLITFDSDKNLLQAAIESL